MSHNDSDPILILLTCFAVNTLHVNLSIPVTAKFRVFPTVEKTVEYARMLERAGAQIITCHGRIREQRGQNTVHLSITTTTIRGLTVYCPSRVWQTGTKSEQSKKLFLSPFSLTGTSCTNPTLTHASKPPVPMEL